MLTLLGEDSKEAYQECKDAFDFYEKVRKGGFPAKKEWAKIEAS